MRTVFKIFVEGLWVLLCSSALTCNVLSCHIYFSVTARVSILNCKNSFIFLAVVN